MAAPLNNAEALWEEGERVLAPTGLSLSVDKTRGCHIDEDLDFLGWRVQRQRWRGPGRQTGGIHLPVKESSDFRDEQGALLDPSKQASYAPATVARDQPRAAGLV